MKRFVLGLGILFATLFTSGKGMSGTYLLGITMVRKETKKSISNTDVIFEGRKVTTDSLGQLVLPIRWSTACDPPPHADFNYRRRCLNALNKRYFLVEYAGIRKKVKNKWKEYVPVQLERGRNDTFHLVLYW